MITVLAKLDENRYRQRVVARTILVCASAALLAGCGSPAKGNGLPVVASTNVYGDIVRQIGGTHVSVTSVLSDPNSDPHLFEPGTANGLAVARARVVVENGLGYDSFMTRLEHAAPNGERQVVVASDVLGVHGREANPHLWYDVPALPRIGEAIRAALARADAAHAPAYRLGLRRFLTDVAVLRRAVAGVRAAGHGVSVATTEPVAGYLISAAGLRDRAPTSFTRPIQQGSEPSPSAVSTMLALVASHQVAALLYNKQAVSPITTRVRAAARGAGVPVVGVTETLPAGLHFVDWQLRQVGELRKALGR